MAIVYKKVIRPSDPTNPNSAKKVYPVVIYRYDVPATLKEFARKIYLSSGVSEGDVYSVLKDFRATLHEMLARGRYVNIEGLGCFYVSLHSKGTEKVEDFTHGHIDSLRVCFRASNDIRLNNGTGSTRTAGIAFKDADRVSGPDELNPADDDLEEESGIDPRV